MKQATNNRTRSLTGWAILCAAVLISFVSLFTPPARAQAGKRLVNFQADIMTSRKIGDTSVMILVGNVVFYHNGTVITCDSAVRYNDRRMECFRNVVINKDEFYAYGDRADYNGAINMARLFSPLIKMVDKDATMYSYDLAFNTKTSIGWFTRTATLKQKDNLFESRRGYYNTNTRIMTGVNSVEIRNPDYSIKSDSLTYNLDTEVSTFFVPSTIWNADKEILSADKGWYDSRRSRYFFTSNAYVLTEDREMWADSIDYFSAEDRGILRRNIQIRDEDQQVLAFGDHGLYWGNRQNAILTQRPSMISFDPKEDSLYMRSDSLFLYTIDKAMAMRQDSVRKGLRHLPGEEEIIDTPPPPADTTAVEQPQEVVADAPERERRGLWQWIKGLFTPNRDKTEPETKKERKRDKKQQAGADAVPEADSTAAFLPADSLAVDSLVMDSLAAAGLFMPDSLAVEGLAADSLSADSARMILDRAEEMLNAMAGNTGIPMEEEDGAEPEQPKTEETINLEDQVPPSLHADSVVRTVKAYRNVKIYRSDFQAVCDSLLSFSLDSTMHLYIDPVMWNGTNQIFSDVMDIYSENQQLKRAEFIGSPFMASKVDDDHFNQIKGKHMEAFFRENELYRLDVRGNGQTYYFMTDEKTNEVNGFFTVESADIIFHISNNEIDSIVWRGNPVYDMIPMDKLPEEQELFLPGFRWEAERRPSLTDVFDRTIRPSQREEYEQLPQPQFPITDEIMKNRERMIRNRIWRERNDRLSPEALEFIRSQSE